MKKIKYLAKNFFKAKRMKTLRNAPILWNLGNLCPERSR